MEPLRAHRDFQRVFRSGTRRTHGGLVVLDTESTSGHSRLGIVASRRIGSAVVRNRIKRRLREAVRIVGLPDGRDIVLIASAGVATVRFATLVKWVDDAFKTASHLGNNGNA